MTSHASILGQAFHRYGPPTPFGIPTRDRLTHLYMMGQTGSGKSTALHNLFLQDAKSGHGVCLIDPHGDLAEDIHRHLKLPHLYWDVADPQSPYGFNPLSKVSPQMRPLVASGLIDALKKQWPDAWGPRMEHLLRQAILALLEYGQADLRDVVRLLLQKAFRGEVLQHVNEPQTAMFWRQEFPALQFQGGSDGVTPIANKFGALLAQPQVSTALCEPETQLRFRSLMDQGQILVVNLAKGRLGNDITNVFGGLLTSTIMNAAFTRHGLPSMARRPFFLFVDEFQNLTTESFASLLSEARKYGLGLVLAHQYLSQISVPVRDALLGNVGSIAFFRLGHQDARVLAPLVPPFSPTDLINQPNFRAVVRMLQNGERLPAFSASMYPPHDAVA